MNRLLKQRNNVSGLVLVLLLLNGCSRDGEKPEYIARVNDSYLTEKDLTAVPEGYGGQQFFKEEQIRNWINRELLYQQAVKEGILEDEKYKNLMMNSARELAAAMMIEKWYAENTPVYKSDDIKDYFQRNQDIFRLNETAYLLNIAEFGDEERAVLFRSAAVESDWNKALNFFKKDVSLKKQEMDKMLFSYDLQPLRLNRIINELYPGEVSLIIPAENQNYLVVNLISKLEAGTIPPFDIIKEEVEKRFIAGRKAEMLKEYYENLYSSNEIDVKK